MEAVRSLPWVRGMSMTLRQRLLGWLKQTERSTSHASTQRTSTAQARRQRPEPDATTPRPRIRSNTVGGVALAWPSDFSHHVRHGPSCSHERDTASLRCARPAAGVPRLSRRTLTHPSHLRFGGKGRESDTDSERPEDGLAALHRRRFVYVLPSPSPPARRRCSLRRSRAGDATPLSFNFGSPCRGAFPSSGEYCGERRPKAGKRPHDAWQAPLGTEIRRSRLFKRCGAVDACSVLPRAVGLSGQMTSRRQPCGT